MEGREKYEKLINIIRNNQSVMEGKEEFADNVMDMIRKSGTDTNKKGFIDFIFAWTDILWIRRSLASASFILISLFLFQQFMIIDRIGELEIRMIDGTHDEFNNSSMQNESTRSALKMMFEAGMAGDSIIIAEKDLIELIKAYRDLQQRYEELENIIIERKNLQGMPGDKKLGNSQKTNLKLKT